MGHDGIITHPFIHDFNSIQESRKKAMDDHLHKYHDHNHNHNYGILIFFGIMVFIMILVIVYLLYDRKQLQIETFREPVYDDEY